MKALPSLPSFSLAGKRALVTGASRGLGLAAAAGLAQAGAAVTLAARSESDLSEAARSIMDAGGLAETLVVDVSDIGQIGEAIAEHDAFDILVNNAGTNRPAPFIDVTQADFDAVMGLNVRSAFFVAQAAARAMLRDAKAGAIINMSSQMGHVGAARRTVYCASKWAIEGLTRAMAAELSPQGIRVNSLCPTFVVTPMTERFFEDAAFKAEVLSNIKLGRLGTLEDIAGAVVFLASDASSLMTGSSLMLDGGWTAT